MLVLWCRIPGTRSEYLHEMLLVWVMQQKYLTEHRKMVSNDIEFLDEWICGWMDE